jgi:hypothetical protein
LTLGAKSIADLVRLNDGTETASDQLTRQNAPLVVRSKSKKMSHMARKHPSNPDLIAPLDEEGSVIRPRDGAESVRSRQQSSSELRATSLDERMEQKVRIASALLRGLPPTDTRVRLFNIAIMRRDESLLDGVLAELNKPASRG